MPRRLRQSASDASNAIDAAANAVREAAVTIDSLVEDISEQGIEIGVKKVEAEDFISRYRLCIKLGTVEK